MESIYEPGTFNASDHFPVKDYFKEYGELCPFVPQNDINSILSSELKINDCIDMEALARDCSIDLLTVPDEPKDFPLEVPKKVSLKTKMDVSYPIAEVSRKLSVPQCIESLTDIMKLTYTERFLRTSLVTNHSLSSRGDMLPGQHFVYKIIVYRPMSYTLKIHRSEKLRFACEINALGSNTLAEVIDKIECFYNIGIFKEVESTKVNVSELRDAKKVYPSQTVFIDGVFYNDYRVENFTDYSEPICKWAKDKNIGKFTTGHMETVKLEDLTPRFGYPYVYIHQGLCEHIITFSDASLLKNTDCLESKEYPRVVSITKPYSPLCFICSSRRASWVIFDCEKLPQVKTFLCTVCCDSFLFIDDKKVCRFRMYVYHDSL